jgi:hypothetical protein
VIRSALLTATLLLLGCSDLPEAPNEVVALEISTPELLSIEVGESLQLTARALNKDGNEVTGLPIEWRAPDPTMTVDPATGVITGVSPGTGRVQALQGLLASGLVQFTVLAPADTLIVTDSVLTVDPAAVLSPPLVARLESFNPPGVLPDRPVAYAVLSPLDGSVALAGGALTDTVNTGTDGAVSTMTLNRVTGFVQPDTAFVEVRASRTRGAPVPGSGQRFLVLFP